jgi:NADP-dependent 3-hydroxy acid dehydrogenase YdfG
MQSLIDSQAISEKFASEGAKVIIVDMNEEVGKNTADELKCDFFKANVTKREDWEHLVKFADEKYGAIDAVVNNAGTTYRQKAGPATNSDNPSRLTATVHPRGHRRRF